MSISLHPEFEAKLRSAAELQGLTVEAYLQRLVQGNEDAINELEALAAEGLRSGEPIGPGPGYWDEKHRQLDLRLKTR